MTWTYFKRYRMEIALRQRTLIEPPTPPGYMFLPWREELLDIHARVKHLSFREEIDAQVFPCFLDEGSCRRLMLAIVRKPGFLPDATWLAVFSHQREGKIQQEFCGTIQGIYDEDTKIGSIQNVGVIPAHRDRGIGQGLLYRCLLGFQKAGADRVSLEVTAENIGAIRLYQRVGFEIVRTVYKVAEVPTTR